MKTNPETDASDKLIAGLINSFGSMLAWAVFWGIVSLFMFTVVIIQIVHEDKGYIGNGVIGLIATGIAAYHIGRAASMHAGLRFAAKASAILYERS